MGSAVLVHGRQRPDSDAGYTLSLAKLQELVERGEKAAKLQREALVNRRAASQLKRKLRRAIRLGPIAHLAGVGRLAAADNVELGQTFLTKPGGNGFGSFLTTARAMYNAALAHREVLATYGMSESVLEQFGKLLDQFEAAVELGTGGRSAHKGATLEIKHVATLIGQTVRVMDARNQQRFENDPQALGEWQSARRVLGNPRSGEPAPGEDGTPATPGDATAPGSETPTGGVRPAA